MASDDLKYYDLLAVTDALCRILERAPQLTDVSKAASIHITDQMFCCAEHFVATRIGAAAVTGVPRIALRPGARQPRNG
jgi:hypothetical protein